MVEIRGPESFYSLTHFNSCGLTNIRMSLQSLKNAAPRKGKINVRNIALTRLGRHSPLSLLNVTSVSVCLRGWVSVATSSSATGGGLDFTSDLKKDTCKLNTGNYY